MVISGPLILLHAGSILSPAGAAARMGTRRPKQMELKNESAIIFVDRSCTGCEGARGAFGIRPWCPGCGPEVGWVAKQAAGAHMLACRLGKQ